MFNGLPCKVIFFPDTRLYLTLIQHEYRCDAFFPNLKVFGLDCVPSDHSVKSSLTLSLIDAADEDVNTLDTQIEDGVTWTYKVLEFVEKWNKEEAFYVFGFVRI